MLKYEQSLRLPRMYVDYELLGLAKWPNYDRPSL